MRRKIKKYKAPGFRLKGPGNLFFEEFTKQIAGFFRIGDGGTRLT
jgi:hypothetical protein